MQKKAGKKGSKGEKKSKVVVKINAAGSRYDPWNGKGIPIRRWIRRSGPYRDDKRNVFRFTLLHFDVEVLEK